MYVNRDSVLAIGILFPILGALAVAARFVSRAKRGPGFAIDDWLCLPALAIVIATGALISYGAVHDLIGHDMYSKLMPPPALFKIEHTIDGLNAIGTGLVRLSFLFLYRRIFRGQVFNIVSWAVIGLVIGCMITFTIGIFANFKADGRRTTTASNPPSQQIDANVIHQFVGWLGITSLILDIIILVMPFFWIWRLHMPNSQKWAVTSVFLCGSFTVCVSVMRAAAGIHSLTYRPNTSMDQLGLKGSNLVNGAISIWLFWQYIEHGTGLIVCCMPTFKSLYDWIRTSVSSRKPSNSATTQSRSRISYRTQSPKQSSSREDVKVAHVEDCDV